MRKLLALLLALTMLLGLASCGKKDNKENNSTVSEDQNQIQVPEPQPEPEPSPLLPDPEKDEMGSTDEILEDNGEPEEERVIRVSHQDVTLTAPGEGFRLTVWDSSGQDPDECVYTTADPAIAVVDEAGGAVTAVAPGTTTVTVHAAYGEEKADFDCIVRCNWTESAKDETGDAEPSLPGSAASLPSLDGFFTTLQGSYEGLDGMMVIEGEVLENYYPGLSDIAAVEEMLVQETMMSTANVAVGLVKLSDSATAEDIQAVQNIFQARITTQAEGGAWYPASCETWENGVITSVSNCVGMFVYPENAQELADLFTEAFTN